ncbi:MAG: hypothetical protein A3G35_17725 [candidate division NC10 bacterium RIFCSPLOWO2_12_FULL_66_18]|nr:MAG: hypothetical protein A3G35_17725 [candidate division NC10 bacterium RIFCSPLOWO2_12_FULL_66_18]
MKVPCPQCGGEVQLQETTGFAGCPFCGTSLVLDLTGVRPHLLYRPRHGGADILPLLRRWCDAEGLLPPSSVSTADLVYHPFWRYGAQGRPRLVPAWPVLARRWTDLALPDAEQVIYDPAAVGAARVDEPSVAEAAARRRAFGEAAPSVGAGDLVHVPFYEAQVTIGPHRVQVSLEACSGRVYPEWMPPGVRRSGTGQGFGAATAILGFTGMFLEAVLIPPAWLAATVVGLTGVALYWMLVNNPGGSSQ